jgi:hypothetical protein
MRLVRRELENHVVAGFERHVHEVEDRLLRPGVNEYALGVGSLVRRRNQAT